MPTEAIGRFLSSRGSLWRSGAPSCAAWVRRRQTLAARRLAARRLAAPSAVNAAINRIADVMQRTNYAGALQYVPQLSWILVLRILDEGDELEGTRPMRSA